MIARLGTEYGGHVVDLSLINEKSIVYSAGIGNDISFDYSLINYTQCTVHGFDPTTKAVDWIKQQPKLSNFNFYDIGISNFDGIANFEPPPQKGWVSFKESNTGDFTFPVKKLSTVMKKLGHSSLDVLKMDIEGSEYAVLTDIINENIDINQITLEFHNKSENEIKEFLQNIKFFDKYKLCNRDNVNYLFIKLSNL